MPQTDGGSTASGRERLRRVFDALGRPRPAVGQTPAAAGRIALEDLLDAAGGRSQPAARDPAALAQGDLLVTPAAGRPAPTLEPVMGEILADAATERPLPKVTDAVEDPTLPPVAAGAQPAATGPAKTMVRAEVIGDSARMVLTLPPGLKVIRAIEPGELLLRFDGPFNPEGMDAAVKAMTGWVEDVRYGYNTLLIRASRAGTRFETTGESGEVAVLLLAPPPKVEQTETRRVEDSRLHYLQSRAMTEANTLYGGQARLAGLLWESPRNVEYLGRQGLNETELGRWRRAVTLYDRALEEAGGEPNIISAKALIHQSHSRELRASHAVRESNLNGERQYTSGLEGSAPLTNGWNITLNLTRVHYATEAAANTEGVTTPASGEFHRANLMFSRDQDDADQSRFAVHVGDEAVGFSAGHRFNRPDRAVTLTGTWREAYADLINSLVAGGWRDRASVAWEERWTPRFTTTLTGAWNHYGITDLTNAAWSSGLLVDARYNLLNAANFTVGYTMDKEQVHHRGTRVDAAGNLYSPLPAADRETHGVSGSWGDNWSDYLSYAAVLGAIYDRATGAYGPTGALSLLYRPLEDLEAGVDLQTSATVQGPTTGRTDQVTSHVRMRF
ncbi:MAG: hypothetical protein HQL82_01215 [Magnetococcales bacterium]|nr:hypothetical protein [Magnetococcales bacterium]